MRRYLVFAAVALALVLGAADNTIASVAIPSIGKEFGSSLVVTGWVISIYQLVAMSTMPLAARVSEIIGGKRALLISLMLFMGGSFLSTISPNIGLLIIFRAVQGIGGCGFLPIAAGIVGNEFPESRQRAIGLFSTILPLGTLIGPNIGGWMVSSFGWHSVFLINLPLGAVATAAVWFLLKADRKQARHARIDWLGSSLLFGSLSLLMLALTLAGTPRLPGMVIGATAAGGVAMLAAFVHWESRSNEPIIDVALLRSQPFFGANAFNFIFGACAFGVFSLVPLYLVSVYGMSTLQSGLILTPRSIGMIAGAAVTSTFLTRIGYRKPMLMGTFIIAASLGTLAFEPNGFNLGALRMSSQTLLLVVMAVSGLGVGIVAPASNNACIELMPHRISTITGLRGVFRQMGMAISITLATLLLGDAANLSRAFTASFIMVAAFMLLGVPIIFLMPSSAAVAPAEGAGAGIL